MDPIARMVAAGAAGAGGSSATYVDDVFSTTLYTSNASSNFDGTEQVITTGIDHTEGFLTWIKNRDDNSTDHVLFDSERTGTNYKWIYSNDDHGEQDTADIFKNPTSTGFTVKQATSGSGTGRTNPSGSKDMVSWTFRKAPGFFDVVTYTGSGSPQTISHNLDSVPGMIIVKCTSHGSTDWTVYHREAGHPVYGAGSYALFLNTTGAEDPSAAYWDNTDPTSTVFTVGVGDKTNGDGKTYVAYLFAHDDARFGTNGDESIIKCGSITTPSSGDFTVDLGFEPQWLMFKKSSSAGGSWVMRDVMRGWKVNGFERLFAESDQMEDPSWSDSNYFPINSTGFGSSTDWLSANTEYIYMAIRRPHKPPTDATDVFTADDHQTGNLTPYYKTGGHVSDFVIQLWPTANFKGYFVSRITGKKFLITSEDSLEGSNDFYLWDYMDGMNSYTTPGDNGYNHLSFKRSPGFCDVVAYTGNGTSGRTVQHNLEAAPELMFVKARDRQESWAVYSSSVGATGALYLNSTGDVDTGAYYWNDTAPTTQQFSLGNLNAVNRNTTNYMAFLFASQDGISKIGSYSGTGGNINVDCGFTAGARFVMIKRTNGTGDWYIWDTARGINSGTEPYMRLNVTGQEVTGNDYIDPLNAGFTVTSSAPAALNTTGGTYLFFAIA